LAFATPLRCFQRRGELGHLRSQSLQLLSQLSTARTIVSRLFRVHDRGDYHRSPEGASSTR
jgi:hypothetical protein